VWWWSAGGPEAATTELETADAGEVCHASSSVLMLAGLQQLRGNRGKPNQRRRGSQTRDNMSAPRLHQVAPLRGDRRAEILKKLTWAHPHGFFIPFLGLFGKHRQSCQSAGALTFSCPSGRVELREWRRKGWALVALMLVHSHRTLGLCVLSQRVTDLHTCVVGRTNEKLGRFPGPRKAMLKARNHTHFTLK
jgi:hypothetical protein